MRVLVTGASGFVGSHVVRTLLERHYTVFGLTRGQRTIPEGATALIGDVEDVASLLNAIRTSNCHIVINCAGVYAWWLPDPSQFEVNATGVQNLLEALAETPAVALVHVSTVLAYGRCCAPKETFNESTPVGPHSSQYAASKHRGDLLAQQAFDAGRLRGCTLFLACCIGADPKLVDSNRDVMRILDLVQGAVPATIVSDVVFTYVHVRDAAEAIVRATERVSGRGGSGSSSGSGSGSGSSGAHRRRTIAVDGERWLIGDQQLSTKEFYGLIAQISGQPAPAYEIPAWLARISARGLTIWSNWVSRRPPAAPVDLVSTAVGGTLCFSADRSKRELGMEYTPIRTAFAEAIDYVTDVTMHTGAKGIADAIAAADERGPLVSAQE
jgi:dihydroflavonol-4-reductase